MSGDRAGAVWVDLGPVLSKFPGGLGLLAFRVRGFGICLLGMGRSGPFDRSGITGDYRCEMDVAGSRRRAGRAHVLFEPATGGPF